MGPPLPLPPLPGARSARAVPLGLVGAVLALVLLTAGGRAAQPAAASGGGAVYVLGIDGVISPVAARYLSREVGLAERAGARLVVLELDTPGGLESSMRQMSQRLLSSRVPVAVYVTPAGGRAASAGMFITMAGNVAAMAPGTVIGAAHPVSLGGGGGGRGGTEQGEDGEAAVRSAKVVNDAAALARAIAVERGRNARWAEQAVRESVSITAAEARSQDVVDLVVASRAQLLEQVDGMEVVTPAGPVVIRAAGAPVVERPMGIFERLLMVVIDPNIAYVLFLLGLAGLAAELYSPGAIVPGVLGGISLILAFVAFGSLPINWAGILLLVVAAGLLAAELLTSGVGFLGAAGVLALILGSLLLYSPGSTPPGPAEPALRVSPWVIAVAGAGFVALMLVVLRALVQARRVPVRTGPGALVGRQGVALTELSPRGRVLVDTEEWTAEADDEAARSGRPVRPGELVRVTGVEGVTLRVHRREAGAPIVP